MKPRRSKFNVNQSAAGKEARTFDGILFDSRGEGERYMELKLLAKTDAVQFLEFQVPLKLHAPNGTYIGSYIADFHYLDGADGCKETWEDFKGYDTELSRWKRKHVLAEYGIEILVTTAPRSRYGADQSRRDWGKVAERMKRK